MNLLNGLAVSDIREIRDEAKMLSNQTRVEQILHAESIVLGDYWGHGEKFRWLFGTIMGNEGILLFPDHESQKIATIEPNVKRSKGWRLVIQLLGMVS